jgi:hypothetical protein
MEGFARERFNHFIELASETADGAVVYRVVRGSLFDIGEGDLLRFDPLLREIDYSAYFVIHIDGHHFLAGLGPRDGRPKGGDRGLHLRASWLDDEETNIPIAPDDFSRMCQGRMLGRYKPDGVGHDPLSAAELEALDQAIKAQKEQEAKEEREREKAARAAGWRASRHVPKDPAWVRDPDDIDLRAPVGTYSIDVITQKLLDQGRVLYRHTDDWKLGDLGAFVFVRSCVITAAKQARERAYTRIMQWPQDRLDARRIAKRLDGMLDDIDGFLTHVGFEQVELFIAFDEDPPDDEERPHKWWFNTAWDRLGEARDALEESRAKLAALRAAALSKPAYNHDGAKDILVAEFLQAMAFGWQLFTGELPGKTGNGLFHDFCVAGWELLGCGPVKDGRFSRRLEKGVHLEMFGLRYPRSSDI